MSAPATGQVAQDLDTIAKAVGLVVLQWANAEQSLDLLIASLWHSFDGKRYAKRLPMMLEPKIAFVRACMTSEATLSPHQVAAEKLLKRFESLSAIRHDLVHGAAASIAQVDNAFVFAKLDIRDGYHHHREVRIEADRYPALVDELVVLGREAYELAAKVFEQVKASTPYVK
jgi:hypothetical protein